MSPKKTVVRLFKDRSEVPNLVSDLKRAGVSGNSIKLVDQAELESHEGLVGEEASRREGIKGLLKRFFGSHSVMEFEHDSLYTDWIRNGGFLVAVNADDSHSGRATEILEGYGDKDAIQSMSQRITETAPLASTLRSAVERTPVRSAKREEETIPVIQEELHVGKRRVQRSSVRVVKHVTEVPVEKTITLRRETVIIDRHPVERIADEADIRAFAESSVEIIETVEEPVVSKEAHVVEEITITKNVIDHEETIRDKVRKTDIEIEGLGPERLRELGFKKDFSTRFGKKGGNYSELASAYEFGSALAFDERYRYRDWASIESETRSLWEAKGGSWKDFGEAIRYGWESIRGRAA